MSQTLTNVYQQTKRNRPTAIDSKVSVKPRDVVKPEHNVPSRRGDDEILREFDLALEYGPCIGISRLERWQRAHKHGLNPPSKVRDLILQHCNDVRYTQSLWKEYDI